MMVKKNSEDAPIDDLSEKLQAAMEQGQILPHDPGYEVARSLVMGKWKDLDEDDRATFNRYIRPVIERRAP